MNNNIVGSLLVSALVLSGCGGTDTPETESLREPTPVATGKAHPTRVIPKGHFVGAHSDRFQAYSSFDEMRKDSVAVVVATATGASTEALVGQDSVVTRTEMTVTEVLWGKSPGATFTLQQNGGQNFWVEPAEEIVQPGGEYLVFLTVAGQAPLYIATGSQGLYAADGTDYRLMTEETQLPKQIEKEKAKQEARS